IFVCVWAAIPAWPRRFRRGRRVCAANLRATSRAGIEAESVADDACDPAQGLWRALEEERKAKFLPMTKRITRFPAENDGTELTRFNAIKNCGVYPSSHKICFAKEIDRSKAAAAYGCTR